MKNLHAPLLLLAFIMGASHATGQTLTAKTVEAAAGEQTTMTVSLSQPSETTALQFFLQLPDGVAIDPDGCSVGTSAASHTLDITQTYDGHYLFVLYHLGLKQLAEGTLVNIPITLDKNAVSAEAQLYTVRSAKADAVSHSHDDVAFAINVAEASAIEKVKATGRRNGPAYSLNGLKQEKPRKGFYIVEGRKTIVRK